jgi:hypothetical protein
MPLRIFWNEPTFRLYVALAAFSWLILLVAAQRRARRLGHWCVWLCGGFVAGADLFR